jgi:L-threonylcarbamoyladenylate synthase
MVETDIVHAGSESAHRRAVKVIEGGGLVAFPTDTVYGLAALPWDADAVMRLYEAKQRPLNMAIPLLLSDAERLSWIATIPTESRDLCQRLITRFWPGGLTLVLPKTKEVSSAISPTATVAVRIPELPLARALIRRAGGVLAVTSANLSGQPSPVIAREVEVQLSGRIDLILDGGECRGGVPSSLVDCTALPLRLLRRGAVSEEALRAVVGPIEISE